MAKSESPAVLRDVQTLFSLGTIHGLTDAQLLDRFRSGTDEGSETAFAGLVARHGSMVLGVCRRTLSDPHDVADAFQATFLVLVRQAETVQARDSLGRWLYGVSRRVAVRAKRASARRSARETDGVETLADVAHLEPDDDLSVILDEEIGRLPEKFRAAVVLCDLQGLGQDEAARQLGCPVGTIKSRLSRGHERLRSRLIRRGIAPAAAILCGESIAAPVPAAMAESTVKAATRFAAGRAGVAGVVSARVIELAQGILRTMLFLKIRIFFATMSAIAALATGVGVLARQAAAPQPPGEQGAAREEPKIKDAGGPAEAVREEQHRMETPNGKSEEQLDRIEALRLDIELLTDELASLKKVLSQQVSLAHQFGLAPGMLRGGGRSNPDAAEEMLKLQRERQEQSRVNSLKVRDVYLEKNKELRQKQRELARLLDQQLQANAETPRPSPSWSVASQPSPRDLAKVPPALEQRISRIERKLDEVMELLKELKR